MNNINNVDRTELEMLQDKFQPISLRDHFAGLAASALINNMVVKGYETYTYGSHEALCKEAYQIADAMLQDLEVIWE